MINVTLTRSVRVRTYLLGFRRQSGRVRVGGCRGRGGRGGGGGGGRQRIQRSLGLRRLLSGLIAERYVLVVELLEHLRVGSGEGAGRGGGGRVASILGRLGGGTRTGSPHVLHLGSEMFSSQGKRQMSMTAVVATFRCLAARCMVETGLR